MSSAGLPEHADSVNAATSDSVAAEIAARRDQAVIGIYRRGVRLPDGRPVGRIGLAPGAGLSGAGTAGADAVTVAGSADPDPSASASSAAAAFAEAPLRRFMTRRVWLRTSSVRSRI